MPGAAAIQIDLLRWAPLVLSLLNVAAYIFLWIAGKTLVSKEELGALATRVVVLERDLASAPDWTSFNELRGGQSAIEGSVRELTGKLEAEIGGLRDTIHRFERQMNTVYTHLLGDGA